MFQKSTKSLENFTILRPEVTKILRIWLKIFCESHPSFVRLFAVGSRRWPRFCSHFLIDQKCLLQFSFAIQTKRLFNLKFNRSDFCYIARRILESFENFLRLNAFYWERNVLLLRQNMILSIFFAIFGHQFFFLFFIYKVFFVKTDF